MPKVLSFILRIALVGACLVYVFWDVDLARLWRTISGYNPWITALAAVWLGCTFLPPAVRIRYLSDNRATLGVSFNCVMLGLGVNNMLPAKLGEVAKAVYLKLKSPMSLSQGLGVVFWERFFDLNAVLLIGLCSAAFLGRVTAMVPLAAVVAAFWIFLFLDRVRPTVAARLIRLLPFEKVRLLAGETLLAMRSKVGKGSFVVQSLYTIVVWAGYYSQFAVVLYVVCGFHITFVQSMAVFAVASMGMAVPSTPGAFGVYEAAIVLSLGWYGVDKEQALAAGIILHLMQFILTTGWTLILMARSNIKMDQFKR